MTKYQDLKNEEKRSWKLKNAKVVQVIAGLTGMMMKNLIEILKCHKQGLYYKTLTIQSYLKIRFRLALKFK